MAAMSMKAAHNYSLFDCKSRVFPWSSSGAVVPNCERHPTFGISNGEDLGLRLLVTALRMPSQGIRSSLPFCDCGTRLDPAQRLKRKDIPRRARTSMPCYDFVRLFYIF